MMSGGAGGRRFPGSGGWFLIIEINHHQQRSAGRDMAPQQNDMVAAIFLEHPGFRRTAEHRQAF